MKPVIDIKNLTVEFKSREGALLPVRNMDLYINAGETYGLVGESGSGKSTVAWVIMQYLAENGRVVSGDVRFKDVNLFRLTGEALRSYRSKKISMVYQDPMTALNPSITVGRQIQEVYEIAYKEGDDKKTLRQAIDILEKVGIVDPSSSVHKFPHQLSGGQQQRIVIAMALACNPDLLILDEPTTGLDVTTEARILDLIADLSENEKSAILFISHNLGVIAKVSHRIGVLYAGRLVEEGRAEDVFTHPLHPYTEGLLKCVPKKTQHATRVKLNQIKGRIPSLLNLPPGCIFHPRCPYAENKCAEKEPNIIGIDGGRKSACFRWQELKKSAALKLDSNEKASSDADAANSTENQKKTILELKNVKKYFGGIGAFERMVGIQPTVVHAVDGVSLRIPPGAVFGLVGESGCGKTTLGRVISRLHAPTDGSVVYDGRDIVGLNKKAAKRYHQEIQMIFQNPDSSLNPKKTVKEILARPLRLFQQLKGKALEDKLDELLRMVRLRENYRSRFPLELSGGEKQRIGIARAFAANPRLIVCDEPVSALDVSVQASILNLILDLQRERDVALLFISHDLSVVQNISDFVGIMYLGEIVELGLVHQVFSPPFHPYTEALLSAVPQISKEDRKEIIRLVGPVPSARKPPSGCRFHTRCHKKIGAICETKVPDKHMLNPDHFIACHLYANGIDFKQSKEAYKVR